MFDNDILTILRSKNIKIDSKGLDNEMEKSKTLARANWKGSGDKSLEEKWFKIREELDPTEFLGYGSKQILVKVFRNIEIGLLQLLHKMMGF